MNILEQIQNYFKKDNGLLDSSTTDDKLLVFQSNKVWTERFRQMKVSTIKEEVLTEALTNSEISDYVDTKINDALDAYTDSEELGTKISDATDALLESQDFEDAVSLIANPIKENSLFIYNADFIAGDGEGGHGSFVDFCFSKIDKTDNLYVDNILLADSISNTEIFGIALYTRCLITINSKDTDTEKGIFTGDLTDFTNISLTLGYEDVAPIKIQYCTERPDDSIILLYSVINEELYAVKYASLLAGNFDITTATTIPCLFPSTDVYYLTEENKFIFGIIGNEEELLSRGIPSPFLYDSATNQALSDSSLFDDDYTYSIDSIYEATFVDIPSVANEIPLTFGNTYYIRRLALNTIKVYPTIADALADTNNETWADETYSYYFEFTNEYKIIVADGNPVLILLDADTHDIEIVDINVTDYPTLVGFPYANGVFKINPDYSIDKNVTVVFEGGGVGDIFKIITVTPEGEDPVDYKSLEHILTLPTPLYSHYLLNYLDEAKLLALSGNSLVKYTYIDDTQLVKKILPTLPFGSYSSIKVFRGRIINNVGTIFFVFQNISSPNPYVYEMLDEVVINYFEINFATVLNIKYYNDAVIDSEFNVYNLNILCSDVSGNLFFKTKMI